MSSYAKIVELAQAGLGPSRIAAQLCIAPSTVSRYLNDARRAGVKVPRFSSTVDARAYRRVTTLLPRHLFDALDAQAEALRISPDRLAAQLLSHALTAQAVLRPRLGTAQIPADRLDAALARLNASGEPQ